MYESGLRTIRTSRDVNRRLFLYLKSSACKAFPAFSVNACQLNSTHINLRVSIYVASIMNVYSSYFELHGCWLRSAIRVT